MSDKKRARKAAAIARAEAAGVLRQPRAAAPITGVPRPFGAGAPMVSVMAGGRLTMMSGNDGAAMLDAMCGRGPRPVMTAPTVRVTMPAGTVLWHTTTQKACDIIRATGFRDHKCERRTPFRVIDYQRTGIWVSTVPMVEEFDGLGMFSAGQEFFRMTLAESAVAYEVHDESWPCGRQFIVAAEVLNACPPVPMSTESVLALQHEQRLRGMVDSMSDVYSLKTVRRSPLYLREELAKDYGFGRTPAILAYIVDPTDSEDSTGCAIFALPFNARTLRPLGRSRTTAEAACHLHVRITRHALARLFERLRTNAWTDVHAALRALSALQHAPEVYGLRIPATVTTPHGVFHVVGERGVWVAKTFIETAKGKTS